MKEICYKQKYFDTKQTPQHRYLKYPCPRLFCLLGLLGIKKKKLSIWCRGLFLEGLEDSFGLFLERAGKRL